MKEIKRTWNFYSAWNWQQELEDLNTQSRQGWQLMHGGLICSRFKYQPDVEYRYQLDYPGKVDEMPRYLETFRDQGWEFVNHSGNGWYYFRKPYDPAADPSEYEIHTDRASLKQMTGRWVKLAAALTAGIGLMTLMILFLFLRQPTLPHGLLLAEMAIITLMLVRGMVLIRRQDVKKTIPHDAGKFLVGFLIYTLCLVGAIVLADHRPSLSVMQQGYYNHETPDAAQTTTGWMAFNVEYPDNYFLSLDLETEHPVTLWLEHADGTVYYTVTGDHATVNNHKLRLKKGDYEVKITYEQEGEQKIAFDLD